MAVLVVNPQIQIPLDEFRFTFARSSGPGGQNVNKVNTKATLHWQISESTNLPEPVRRRLAARHRRRLSSTGEFLISSQRFRDQGRNTADCLEKLRQLLVEAAAAPKPRKATRPTRASAARRLRQKQGHARKKLLRRPPDDA